MLILKGGWLHFPRPKTGIDRRAPLWKETIVALKEAIDRRPGDAKTKRPKSLFF